MTQEERKEEEKRRRGEEETIHNPQSERPSTGKDKIGTPEHLNTRTPDYPTPKHQTPSFVVGIAGGSASGKTTFTKTLVETLAQCYPQTRVEMMGMDKYFYRGAHPGPRFVSPSSGEDLPDNNHPNSADNARFVADVDAHVAAPDAPDVLIVEGLMALHVEEIRQRLNMRLFIELEADTRALRRLLRDMNGGRGSTDPRWIATYYQECARVGHDRYVEPSRVHADLIVRGDADFARVTPFVAAAIVGALRRTG